MELTEHEAKVILFLIKRELDEWDRVELPTESGDIDFIALPIVYTSIQSALEQLVTPTPEDSSNE